MFLYFIEFPWVQLYGPLELGTCHWLAQEHPWLMLIYIIKWRINSWGFHRGSTRKKKQRMSWAARVALGVLPGLPGHLTAGK